MKIFSHAHFEFLLSTTKNLLLVSFSIFILFRFVTSSSSYSFSRCCLIQCLYLCVYLYGDGLYIDAFYMLLSRWIIRVRAFVRKAIVCVCVLNGFACMCV